MKKFILFGLVVFLVIFGLLFWQLRPEEVSIFEPEPIPEETYIHLHFLSEDYHQEMMKEDAFLKLRVAEDKQWIPRYYLDHLASLYVHDDYREGIYSLSNQQQQLRYHEEESRVFLNERLYGEQLFWETYVNSSSFLPLFGIELIEFLEEGQVFIIDEGHTFSHELLHDTSLYLDEDQEDDIQLEGGSLVYAYPHDEKYMRVITDTYQVGLAERAHLVPLEKEVLTRPRLSLVWDQFRSRGSFDANPFVKEGFNVISPTWFELADGEGNIDSYYNPSYDAYYRQEGVEVWPLLSNAFNPDRTSELLRSTRNRMAFIDNVVNLVVEHDFTGINIDFENVYLKDRSLLPVLINELAVALKPYDLTLSMDVTAMNGSDNWSKSFDRKRLARSVDYMMFMGYDEFWAASPISGPVASLDWQRESIEALLMVIPPEKLVLGIPFYTRIWLETPSKEVANKMDVRSESMGIAYMEGYLERKNLSPFLDTTNGLYYTGFIEEGVLKKLWVENAETLQWKLDLVEEYQLAGAAAWRLSFATEELFQLMKNFKEGE